MRSFTIAILILFLTTSAMAATYYIAANGNDSNNGISKSTPWAHLPGMPNCVGICASTTPKAGDNFIFRGGDTWGASSLGVDWQWGGTSSARIYIGADQTWFAGASWARPKFDCQNTECGSHFIQVSANGVYVTIDNLEWTGIRQVTGSVKGIDTLANYTEVKNIYMHGWSHGAGAPDSGRSFAFATNGSNGPVLGTSFHDSVVDGSDTSKDMFGGSDDADQVYNNVFRYVCNGVRGGHNDVHGNLIEHITYCFSGDHANGISIFDPLNGSHIWVYNNVVHDNSLASGSMAFWVVSNGGCTGCVNYVYNNVLYDVDNGIMALGSHPSDGNAGTFNVYNNTIDAHGGSCMGNGEASPRSTTHYANNHCLNAASFCDGTGTTCVNDGGNLLQTAAQAAAAGYTSSQTYAYSPTSGGSPTVGAGINLAFSCSGNVGALCSDTTYPTYDAANHRVVMRTITARPVSAAWDIGAYQYAASTVLYGDVSENGSVTAYDASLAAQYAVGSITLTASQITKADVSGNGSATSYDASLIAQYAVGLIDKFPVQV